MDSRLASWIFGSILLVFILVVFFLAPNSLPQFKQRLLAFICALLAGFFAFFFTGTIGVNFGGSLGKTGQFSIQAAGGAAAFVVVLWWWYSSSAPIKVEDEDVPISVKKRPRPKKLPEK
ncbi:MAG: hypothetical protein AABM67_20015 [Acidobacteriota bacterium]